MPTIRRHWRPIHRQTSASNVSAICCATTYQHCSQLGTWRPAVAQTEVLVEFQRPPPPVFDDIVPDRANYLRFRLSPEVVIALGTRAKLPGEAMVGEAVELIALHQHCSAMAAYERLLWDAVRGDATLFARQDEVEAAWQVVDPVLNAATPLYRHEPNTWRPSEADRIIALDGGWHTPGPADRHASAFVLLKPLPLPGGRRNRATESRPLRCQGPATACRGALRMRESDGDRYQFGRGRLAWLII